MDSMSPPVNSGAKWEWAWKRERRWVGEGRGMKPGLLFRQADQMTHDKSGTRFPEVTTAAQDLSQHRVWYVITISYAHI